MQTSQIKFQTFLWRMIAAHMITYFIAGISAFYLFNYTESFATGKLALLMKPTDSPWVAAGPALQIFRGSLFAIVLWPFRAIFLQSEKGWLKLWGLFLGLAIFGTCGPAIGSFEGLIFTTFPVLDQLLGLREVIFQTLIFSLLLQYWFKNPNKWLQITAVTLVVLISMMSVAGFVAAMAK